VPKKPPAANSLVESLIKLGNGGAKAIDLDDAGPFLVAFGWADRSQEKFVPTAAGAAAATAWRSLRADDVEGWSDWMEDAAVAILGASTVRAAIDAVKALPLGTARDDTVTKALGVSTETARKLVVFAATFGALIRLDGKLWAPTATTDAQAVVLESIKAVAARSGGSGAPAERVFTDLLTRCPLPLHVFRRAIFQLVESGAIERDRGTGTRPPKSGETHVRIRTLISDGKSGVSPHDVDLSHGTFLIPGTTMQDLVLRGEQL
jgi:hypothetical protein